MFAFSRVSLICAAALFAVRPLAAETPRERLLNATFNVFNSSSTATGLLAKDPDPRAANTNVLLVSAAHTFAKAHGDHVLLVCRISGLLK